MAKVGKDVNKSEYEYIKEIMMFMSPTEFQNFKNSISGIASEFNVQKLKEIFNDQVIDLKDGMEAKMSSTGTDKTVVVSSSQDTTAKPKSTPRRV